MQDVKSVLMFEDIILKNKEEKKVAGFHFANIKNDPRTYSI